MISTRWLHDRQPYWTRLETLLDQISRSGIRSLTRPELQEFGLLYRQIAADLAIVREDRGSGRFAEYLNQLLARAHHTIYSPKGQGPAASLRFFVRVFPLVFRQNLAPCLVSLALFAGAASFGAYLT